MEEPRCFNISFIALFVLSRIHLHPPSIFPIFINNWHSLGMNKERRGRPYLLANISAFHPHNPDFRCKSSSQLSNEIAQKMQGVFDGTGYLVRYTQDQNMVEIWDRIYTNLPPASRSNTVKFGFSESLEASTHPAVPNSTILSNSKQRRSQDKTYHPQQQQNRMWLFHLYPEPDSTLRRAPCCWLPQRPLQKLR